MMGASRMDGDSFQVPPGEDALFALSGGGEAMLLAPCGSCCGSCATAYLYFACPPQTITGTGSNSTIPEECIGSVFPPIQICSDATCNGTPISQVLKIIVNGRCYSRPVEQSPGGIDPATPIYDSADLDCVRTWNDCSDAVCVSAYGRRFVAASPCYGQNYSGPPIYFLACAVLACDWTTVHGDGISGLGIDGGLCVMVAPTTSYAETDLPAGAVKRFELIDGHRGGKCCACLLPCSVVDRDVTACNGIGAATTITRHCCCSNARTVTGTISSLTMFDPMLSSLLSREVRGSGIWQYDDLGVLYNQVGGTATITETYSNGPPQVSTVNMTPWAGCAADEVPSAFPFPLSPPFGGVEQCDPSAASDGDNIIGGGTGRAVFCKNAQLGGSWTQTRRSDGVVQQRANSSSVWSVVYSGRCSGQCAGEDDPAASGIRTNRGNVQVAPGGALGDLGGGCAGCGVQIDPANTGGITI